MNDNYKHVINISNDGFEGIGHFFNEYPFSTTKQIFKQEKIEDFKKNMKEKFNCEIIDLMLNFQIIIFKSELFLIAINKQENIFTFKCYFKGFKKEMEDLNLFMEDYNDNVEQLHVNINYLYAGSYGMDTRNVKKLATDFNFIIKDLYVGLDIDIFMKDFFESNESILIITGEPGIGKTTLVKYMMKSYIDIYNQNLEVAYSKDEILVREDKFWIKLLQTDYKCLILDDFDEGLQPRETSKEPNKFISKILSFSDGIFDNKMKIIITTNRPIEEIDKALLGPGRCFDILRLKILSKQQAEKIWTEQLELSKKRFEEIFKDVENISQALLMMEAKNVKDKKKPYLIDESISVKKEFIEGFMKRKIGFIDM